MLEVKVNVELTSQDLSEAIAQLALAIKGHTIINHGELTIPLGTPMTVADTKAVSNQTVAEQKPELTTVQPQMTVQPQVTAQTQVPVMNAPVQPTVPAPLDLDAISRAGAALVDQGKMQEILLILQKYGVMAVNQLDPGQYPAFADDLRALGAAI